MKHYSTKYARMCAIQDMMMDKSIKNVFFALVSPSSIGNILQNDEKVEFDSLAKHYENKIAVGKEKEIDNYVFVDNYDLEPLFNNTKSFSVKFLKLFKGEIRNKMENRNSFLNRAKK